MQKILPQLDHYEILGVARNATSGEIRSAYTELVKIYHPDRATPQRREGYKRIFQMITEAYRVLNKPDEKKRYDATLPVNGHYADVYNQGLYKKSG